MNERLLGDSSCYQLVTEFSLAQCGSTSLSASSGGSQFISDCDHHLFNFASQFRTTDMGAVSACRTFVLIRNSCPSRRTSYTNTSFSDTCSRGLAWKRATGVPESNLAPVVTGATITLLSEDR